MSGPLASIGALIARATRPPPDVGTTPHTVVWSENKWRLLRFAPERPAFATPILYVPSLINRWYVLDLGPGRSLIEWLVGQGHVVYAIDWGTPADEDRYLTWDDIGGRYLGRAVRHVCRASATGKAHVLGYCLGGTLAAAYVASHPEGVASLLALATPVDFDRAAIMTTWTRISTFDPAAIVDAFGNVPAWLLQASFRMLRPTAPAAKAVALLDRAWDDEFLDGFLATERWGNDNVALPGACYASYLTRLYRENQLVRGQFSVLGRPARLAAITCPVLAVAFEDDAIVPVDAARPLVEQVTARDKQLVVDRGGHIGAVVSRKAATRLWPQLHAFWVDRDRI